MTKTINTYNESSLHRSLKNFYCEQYGGKTEQTVDTHICDIVAPDGLIIEIQTKNISSLHNKILDLLDKKKKVIVVHPLITKKIIETYNQDGTLATRSKSRKVQTVYTVMRELTGMTDILTRKNFTLELVEAEITEIRRKTDDKVQIANRSRRFLKAWVPVDKKLNEIGKVRMLKTKNDYKKLIPKTTPNPFIPPELAKEISSLPEFADLTQSARAESSSNAHLLLWIFTRMGIVKEVGKKGRSRLYSI